MKEYSRSLMKINFSLIDRPKVICRDTDLATLKKSDLKVLDERARECSNNCNTSNTTSNITVNDECFRQCLRRTMMDIKRLSHGCRICLRDIERCIKTSNYCDSSCDIATLDARKCEECAYMSGCLIGKCINPVYLKDLF